MARGVRDGHELAQVAHLYSGTGDDLGWSVYLSHDQGELFDQFESAEQAMAAAEAALQIDEADQI